MLASSPPAAKTGADRRSGGEGAGGGRGAGGGGGGGVGVGAGVGGGGGGGLAARVRFSVGRERRIGGAEGRRTGGSSEARSSQRGVHRATVGQRAGTAGVAARGRGEAGGASGAERGVRSLAGVVGTGMGLAGGGCWSPGNRGRSTGGAPPARPSPLGRHPPAFPTDRENRDATARLSMLPPSFFLLRFVLRGINF